MAVYFLDTSALAKRYVQETGTTWIMGLLDPASGHDAYIVRIAAPEGVAAFYRKVRTHEMTLATAIFRSDYLEQYQIVEVTSGVVERAMALVQQHPLRAYDAVHLATALELQFHRTNMALSPLTFLSADLALNTVATAAGLVADNPNAHE